MSEAERAEVLEVLARHLPPGVSVGVFGSRAGGAPKSWSDLDLVLEGPEPLPLALLAELAEAFDESPLPWKVDLVDRHTVAEGFGRIIDAARIPLD
ncbi:nucleotidyltransferase domain-containing protein [Novosphingobium cyanobacteriorum]|uniref:Nucleotidyltransferase domain-containing protein n=1 Tax=Novosphingobium cyanobacteriorum TaxID=3024215 RepID=A0ABT6CG65_9SPHN|nr:nucleotidyltransferase domain-containing protein [Novosphingobium cyanobacteriorum]MDF8332919.1 nucleotidyltransferase domain-containing protein [Novosphingobium cyanobacteriorum]